MVEELFFIIGIIILLLLPGYLLMKLVFSNIGTNNTGSPLEKIIMSFTLSITSVPILAIVLNLSLGVPLDIIGGLVSALLISSLAFFIYIYNKFQKKE